MVIDGAWINARSLAGSRARTVAGVSPDVPGWLMLRVVHPFTTWKFVNRCPFDETKNAVPVELVVDGGVALGCCGAGTGAVATCCDGVASAVRPFMTSQPRLPFQTNWHHVATTLRSFDGAHTPSGLMPPVPAGIAASKSDPDVGKPRRLRMPSDTFAFTR